MRNNSSIVNSLYASGYLASGVDESLPYKDRAGFQRRPHTDRLRRLEDTPRSVVRHVTVLGDGGHMSCFDMPVSVPRVSILEAANA